MSGRAGGVGGTGGAFDRKKIYEGKPEPEAKRDKGKPRIEAAVNQIPKTPLRHRHDNRRVAKGETLSILESFALIFEPKTPKILTVHTKLGTFKLDSKILPSELKDVDKSLLLDAIAKKIEAGGLLYQEILNGEKEAVKAVHKKFLNGEELSEEEKSQLPRLEDISNLMWFLQAKAESLEEKGGKKVGSFTSGALSIEDPNQYLVHYLDMCNEVYQRKSSHIKEFQDAQGGTHRGIDFNPGDYDQFQRGSEYNKDKYSHEAYLDNALPYDKRTVMIAPMLQSSGLIDTDRVLIKMELYGCASALFKDRPLGPKSRESNQYDVEHTLGHAWEYLLSLWRTITGGQTKAGTRKERVPSDIKNEYKNFIKRFESYDAFILSNDDKLASILQQNYPLSLSGGIRVMVSNIKALQRKISNDKSSIDPKLMDSLSQLLKKINDRYPEDTLNYRIGDEVMLKSSYLVSINP